jgi:hypothetical protein
MICHMQISKQFKIQVIIKMTNKSGWLQVEGNAVICAIYQNELRFLLQFSPENKCMTTLIGRV